MIFKINKVDNDFLQRGYDQAMKELNEFYGLSWAFNRPQVIIVPDRKTLEDIRDIKTEPWQIGWVNGNIAFMLDNETMEENSSHKKHSPEKYQALVKHELSHVFFRHLSKSDNGPEWFWEGVAIYSSGQLDFFKPITKLEKFLDSTDDTKDGLYEESGFAIKLLVDKYGKEKLLELIKNLPQCPTNEDFTKKFEKIYAFAPSYEKFNNCLKS